MTEAESRVWRTPEEVQRLVVSISGVNVAPEIGWLAVDVDSAVGDAAEGLFNPRSQLANSEMRAHTTAAASSVCQSPLNASATAALASSSVAAAGVRAATLMAAAMVRKVVANWT